MEFKLFLNLKLIFIITLDCCHTPVIFLIANKLLNEYYKDNLAITEIAS